MNFYSKLLVISTVDCGEFNQGRTGRSDWRDCSRFYQAIAVSFMKGSGLRKLDCEFR